MATLRAPRLAAARTPGAILRALLVFALTLAPFLLAGDVGAAARDATLFAGASAALVVLFEYASRTPALVNFRDAKPLNRLRFAMVAGTLLATMAFIRSTPGGGVREAGEALGRLLGGWASPVGMMAESLSRPSALGPDLLAQGAAAVALTSAAILSLLVSALIWFGRWPGPAERFNRFTNLPTFDEADAADAPPRLLRLGLQAIVMALALPAALLALVAIAAWMIEADALSRPLPLAWTVSIWAAASGAQLIRGVALIKLSRVLAAADPA